MDKTCYYIFFAFSLLLNCCLVQGYTNLATDQSALAALKSHITSDPRRLLTTNWTGSASVTVCSWIGVTCGLRHRRVTSLNISDMGLSGTIPPHLGNLSFLVSLDIRKNLFDSTLPQELSLLRRLEFISLFSNNFMGDIPSWLPALPKLKYLSLSNNSFSGVIPRSLANLSSVQTLDFSFNSLHGNIPEELGRLGNLRALSIQDNHISGGIPAAVFNISTLRELEFTSNGLSGSLPIHMCRNLPFLQGLHLSYNDLSGEVPQNLSQCSQLQVLSVSYNSFTGQIPASIGKLHSLRLLALGSNKFNAILPSEIGQLHQLEKIHFGNNISPVEGVPIPPQLFNISTLVTVAFFSSNLSGTLPTNMCYTSLNLELLQLSGNRFSGEIPESISNCSNLRVLDLTSNQFTGFIPLSLGNLGFLQYLLLGGNSLKNHPSHLELSFITSLTNCRSLKTVEISKNPVQGILPASIGNFSSSLQTFSAFICKIKGSIPTDIGNLTNLVKLSLFKNELSGNIPLTIKHLGRLEGLHIHNNLLEGPIPEGVCDLLMLDTLYLSNNKLSGQIPECFGKMASLRYLYLFSNMLSSSIPSSLWQLKDLLQFDLSSNSLSGGLSPDVSNLVGVNHINLEMNQLSGSIPSSIGSLVNVAILSLAHNRFVGSIPGSVGSMLSLKYLDFSYNNLSGPIPKSLEKLQHLNYFDVSFNSMSGEIPTAGPFTNFTMDSFMGNEALCGAPRFNVPLCPTTSHHKSKVVAYTLFVLAGVAALILLVSLVFILRRYRSVKAVGGVNELILGGPERISYLELLQATEQFNESNLIGIGSSGSVYRGVLRDGKAVAVKVFKLESFNRFDAECEALCNIRHRNLTKVITSCSNEDFRALILEYMPKGSLDEWLHSENRCLDIMQRLNIMVHVASALEYLHHGYSTPIVHCDVKPSNVLLDEEMTAHVSDFGVTKLLGDEESTVLTNTLATLGYIAPEYGLVSTRCDVYSYGVVLMETFTGKRPSDEMFDGVWSLKSWVETSVPDAAAEVIDVNLVMNLEEAQLEKQLQCASSIFELALKCCSESGRDRINMKEALAELGKIKLRFTQ